VKFIYNLFYGILLFIGLPFFVFFTRKKGYNAGLKERFVLYKDKPIENCLWFHCASVGELNTVYPLIEYYSKEYNLLITVSSPRGKEFAHKKIPFAKIRYLPFDFSFLIRKFVKIYNPKLLIVAEGEFWYSFITETHNHNPIVSVNTRISPKTFKTYKKFSFLYKKIFENIDQFLVRSNQDKEFIIQILDNDKKVKVCGDLKLVSSKVKGDLKFDKNGKKVLIAGSTHYPEEEIIIDTFLELKKEFPDLALIIAPRHLERMDEITDLLKSKNLDYQLRMESEKLEKDIYIINTLGELSKFYKYADVVFVGGTFAPVGGHNVLEPILENKPVIIGPNYEKIKELYEEFSKYGILKSVKDKNELKEVIKKFLTEGFSTNIDFDEQQKQIFECYVSNINKFLKNV